MDNLCIIVLIFILVILAVIILKKLKKSKMKDTKNTKENVKVTTNIKGNETPFAIELPKEPYSEYQQILPWCPKEVEWVKYQLKKVSGIDDRCIDYILYRLVNTFDFPYVRQYYVYDTPDITVQINVKQTIERAYLECGQQLGYIPSYVD